MACARPVELEPDHTGVRKKESIGSGTKLLNHFRYCMYSCIPPLKSASVFFTLITTLKIKVER